MGMNRLLWVCSLFIVRFEISYAGEHIEVSDSTCGLTYDVNMTNKITLTYHKDQHLENPRSRCVITIENNNTNMEICIQTPGPGQWDPSDCFLAFKYYIGHLPNDTTAKGYTCSDFHPEPLCTKESSVFAVFADERFFHIVHSMSVVIFLRGKVAITTHFDDSYTSGFDETATIIIIVTVIGVLGVFIVTAVCCKLSRNKIRLREASESTVQYSREPSLLSRDHRSRNQSHNDDVPATSSLIHSRHQQHHQQQQQQPQHQQHLHGDEEDGNMAIEDPVYQNEMPIPTRSVLGPENLPLRLGQSTSDSTTDEDDEDDYIITTPTAPVLEYYDLQPPPYPGC